MRDAPLTTCRPGPRTAPCFGCTQLLSCARSCEPGRLPRKETHPWPGERDTHEHLQSRYIREHTHKRPSLVSLQQNWNGRSAITTLESTLRVHPAPTTLSTLAECRIAVLGAGRLGTSLALAWRKAGAVISGLSDPREAALERADWEFDLSTFASLDVLVASGPNVICLAVPDAVLPEAARALAILLAGLPADQIATLAVLHTSGATPVEVLAPCADAGAVTLTLHPLQTFSDPSTGRRRLSGCTMAVTSGPRDGWELGELLAHAVGAHPFFLKEEDRILYHAAACMASNYLVALEHASELLFRRAGLPSDGALQAFLPLVQGAVDNMSARGTVAALTGPLSRGDIGTISAHLDELAAKAPGQLPLYRTLGLATIDLVRQRAELPPAVIAEMEALLTGSPQHQAGPQYPDPTRTLPTDQPPRRQQ